MDKEKLTEATKRIAKQCLATISNLTDVLYIHPYMLKVEKTNRRKLRNTFGHMVFDYCIEHHDEPILRRWHPAIWYTRGRGVPVEINVVLDFGTFFSRSNFIFMNADEPVALGAVVLAEFFLPRLNYMPDEVGIWIQPDYSDVQLFAFAIKDELWRGIVGIIEYDVIGSFAGGVVPTKHIKHHSGRVRKLPSGRMFLAEKVFVETDHIATSDLLDQDDV